MKTKGLPAQAICNFVPVVVLLVFCGFTDAAQHTISGVPDYQQNDFDAPPEPGTGDCAPTAAACVLGYWNSNGYGNLIDGSSDYGSNLAGVTELVNFLKADMGYPDDPVEGGVLITDIPIGIEATANDRRGYSFSADNWHPVSWTNLKSEINADRPFVFSILHPYYGGWHSVAGVGYTEDEGGGGGTYYLNSIADSYVDSSDPEQNHGSVSSISVGKWHDGSIYETFVKFDLSVVPSGENVQNATLRLYCNYLSGSDQVVVWLPDASWTELGITWTNRPSPDLNADYVMFDPPGSGQTWEIDVTDLASQWVDGSKDNYGFLLSGYMLPTGNWAGLTSREAGSEPWRPELVVNTGGWSDEIVIVHDNWTQYFPYDPDVWLNFNECGGPYLTWVQPGGNGGGDSYEPDDTWEQASEIQSDSPQNHSIVPATDEDWVWFSISEESEVIIETSGPSGDTRMWLYDSGLNFIEDDDDHGSDLFSRIDRICGLDPLPAGTYYVKIDEYNNDDEIASYDITLTVNICAGSPGQLQFSNATYDVRENDGIATITVTRTGGSEGAVTVDYETNDGTAIADYDYEPTNGTLNFADGETSETFSVTILDDDLIENDESISQLLSNPTGGASLGSQNTAILTIIDNEPDLNNDGTVDSWDYSGFAEHWMNSCTEPDWCEGADFDSSSEVDFNDLATICEYWLDLRYDILHTFSLDSNPGWTIDGEWAFGQPVGGGGSHGNPDPNSVYSGYNVYGVNLYGDYTIAVGGPYHLTAGPFDCNDYHSVHLKFARWLNTDTPTYVASKIEASNNGTDWGMVWEHTGGSDITDDSWQIMEYDISSVADNQDTVYLRWSYQILSAQAYSYSGWNIDDIELWGAP